MHVNGCQHKLHRKRTDKVLDPEFNYESPDGNPHLQHKEYLKR